MEELPKDEWGHYTLTGPDGVRCVDIHMRAMLTAKEMTSREYVSDQKAVKDLMVGAGLDLGVYVRLELELRKFPPQLLTPEIRALMNNPRLGYFTPMTPQYEVK